jgi:outer membrane protein TolC
MKSQAGYDFPRAMFLCVFLSLVLSCYSSQDVQSRLQQDFRGIFDKELRTLTAKKTSFHSGETTFIDAFLLATQRDDRIKLNRVSYKQTLLDMKQAQSTKWPRLFGELIFEVPIKSNNDNESSFVTGGLFLKYNLLKAAFSSDSITVESAKAKRTLLQEQIMLQEIYSGLIFQLAELDMRRREIGILSTASKTAKLGVDRAMLLRHLGYRSLNEVRTWEMDLSRLKIKNLEAQKGVSDLEANLRVRLGLDLHQKLVITDCDKYFPQEEEYKGYVLDVPTLVAKAFEQRNDIRIAEIDLFIAEMSILEAKRKRLPDLSLSLGLGNVALSNLEGTAPLVPSLRMSLPLVDMGDTERFVQRAEMDRDKIKEGIRGLSRKVSAATQIAAAQLKFALEVMEEMQHSFLMAQNRARTLKDLVLLHRIDPLDQYRAEIVAAETAIDYYRSVYSFRKAAIHLKETLGTSMQEGLQGEAIRLD